ncbi:unnamed protein product [Notodromas monacha]|uniref:Uncharacterized protein n=1 Tax=Notodromas monacha TaxID=399045 RepID=A0A7R9BX33_9CRUS|nr:unnamed protein product [Notodromas monacha]CAG0922402.1 unnamed protein product [Notodromas monacha]
MKTLVIVERRVVQAFVVVVPFVLGALCFGLHLRACAAKHLEHKTTEESVIQARFLDDLNVSSTQLIQENVTSTSETPIIIRIESTEPTQGDSITDDDDAILMTTQDDDATDIPETTEKPTSLFKSFFTFVTQNLLHPRLNSVFKSSSISPIVAIGVIIFDVLFALLPWMLLPVLTRKSFGSPEQPEVTSTITPIMNSFDYPEFPRHYDYAPEQPLNFLQSRNNVNNQENLFQDRMSSGLSEMFENRDEVEMTTEDDGQIKFNWFHFWPQLDFFLLPRIQRTKRDLDSDPKKTVVTRERPDYSHFGPFYDNFSDLRKWRKKQVKRRRVVEKYLDDFYHTVDDHIYWVHQHPKRGYKDYVYIPYQPSPDKEIRKRKKKKKVSGDNLVIG